MVVNARVGSPQVHLERVQHGLGVVQLSKRRDITPLLTGVIRNQHGDLNLADIETTRAGKSLRKILEDLSSSDGVLGNVVVVEGEQETNLDQLRPLWLRCLRIDIDGQDNLGDICWQRLGGGTSGSLSNTRKAE